ncbi:hypothetical protein AKJ16_DCAP19684 [Drosera capensis]
MEMKKIAFVALVAATSMTAVLATETAAPAPAPSGAMAALPAVGSLVAASVVSVINDGGQDRDNIVRTRTETIHV